MLLNLFIHVLAWEGKRNGFILGAEVGAGSDLYKFKSIDNLGITQGGRKIEFTYMSDSKLGYASTNQLTLF